MTYITNDWNGTEYFPIHNFQHVELYKGDTKQAAHYYRSAFGFEVHAYCGPETRVHDSVSYLLNLEEEQMSTRELQI